LDRGARVAGPIRGIEEGLVAFYFEERLVELLGPGLDLLEAEDVRLFLQEPGQEPLRVRGAEAVDVPGEDLHEAGYFSRVAAVASISGGESGEGGLRRAGKGNSGGIPAQSRPRREARAKSEEEGWRGGAGRRAAFLLRFLAEAFQNGRGI